MNTIEQFNEHVMQTYGRIGLVMESGHGQTAVGEDGKEYIDFTRYRHKQPWLLRRGLGERYLRSGTQDTAHLKLLLHKGTG